MIKINLIKEEGKGRAEMKMYVFLYAVSLSFVLLLCILINSSYSSRLSELSEQKEQLTSEKTTLMAKTSSLKKLEEEKQLLRDKLLIIAKLKRSKTGPVQVLDRINLALPEKAWLSDISEMANDGMKIEGLAFDNESISVFVDDLARSEFFPSVKIEEVSQEIYKDVKVSKFSLSAKVRFEGKVNEAEPEKKG